MLVIGAGGAIAVACVLVILLGGLTSRSDRAPVTAAKTRAAASGHADSDGAGPISPRVVSRTVKAGQLPTCQPVSGASDYVNPLAGAHVRPERIDQGVDYAGSGTLTAIGAARVTFVATSDTGWPGSFIAYRLLDGPDAGCYVYYAEGVNPVPGLRVGQTLASGQAVATIISGWATGIELGWAAGTGTVTYAAKAHQWNATSDENSAASPAGRSFSALIASLHGPPGRVEG